MNDDDPARFAYLAEGNAKQARKRVAADVLIHDTAGRILLVNPTYKDYWDLPGGMAESNEPPRKAAEREVREELGLSIAAGRLLLLDWIGPHGPWDDQLLFIFDGGTIDENQLANATVMDPEISEFDMFDLPEAVRLLRPDLVERLLRTENARTIDSTDYRE
jgi:8-oxo-dGTP pyrophosphatase MutT (NUDIX family)